MPKSSAYTKAVRTLASATSEADLDRAFLERIGAVLDEVPGLASHRWELVVAMESLLAADDAVEAMAGGPTAVVAEVARENAVRAGSRRAVLDEPMLEADAVADAVGSRSVNRAQYASTRRRKSELLGVPVQNRYLFPAFQLDARQGRIVPQVAEVNRTLGSAEDPWGVASWWFSANARLSGSRPADVVVDPAGADAVVAAARSLVAPVG